MEIKSNVKRGKSAILFIWVLLILHFFSLFFLYHHYLLVSEYKNALSIDIGLFTMSDFKLAIVRLLAFIASIISIILFLRWFRRAYYNLEQMNQNLEYNNSEALWSWFIPFVNFFRPFQIMKELYSESKKILHVHNHPASKKLNTIILIIWWSLSLLAAIATFVQMQKYGNIIELNINTIESLTISGMALDIIGIPNCIVTLIVLYKYTKIEPVLRDIHLSSGGSDYEISKHLIS